MRAIIVGLIVGAMGCSAEQPGFIALDCYDTECTDGAPVGVGGNVWYTLYRDGELADDAFLVSTDDDVLQLQRDGVSSVVGAAPGTARVLMIHGDEVLAEAELAVGEVTELRLESAELDGDFEIAAWTPTDIDLVPLVGFQASSGTHYYKVLLDGEPYSCWGRVPRFCNGPVYYGSLHLDGLAPGPHDLVFQSVDGGRDFAFGLTAR